MEPQHYNYLVNKKVKILALMVVPILLFIVLACVVTVRQQNRFIVVNRTCQTITRLQIDIAYDIYTFTNIPNGQQVWFPYSVPPGHHYVMYSYLGKAQNGGDIALDGQEATLSLWASHTVKICGCGC